LTRLLNGAEQVMMEQQYYLDQDGVAYAIVEQQQVIWGIVGNTGNTITNHHTFTGLIIIMNFNQLEVLNDHVYTYYL
jgi:hypothetical protein